MAGKSIRESKFNTEKRTKKNALRHRKPDNLMYEDVDLTYKEPYTFVLDR